MLDHAIKVYKGTNPDVDSYSVFWDNKKLTDTTLCAQLRLKNATDIYICGLAYDVCVGMAVLVLKTDKLVIILFYFKVLRLLMHWQ